MFTVRRLSLSLSKGYGYILVVARSAYLCSIIRPHSGALV
jgi:hypothetical protein